MTMAGTAGRALAPGVGWILGLVGSLALMTLVACGGGEPAGQGLYVRYCASCHGVSGRGDGPVAPHLRRPPTDLTALAQRGDGGFDADGVRSTIDGRKIVAEHGSREMPVWGAVFDEQMRGERFSEGLTEAHLSALVRYVESLQSR
jgi:mono/diheme cytochrome c family protein